MTKRISIVMFGKFQVLSKSIADALLLTGRPEVRETERFVRLMNRFFDMFNVRSDSEGVKKRNSDLLPYYSCTITVNSYVQGCIDFLFCTLSG